MVDVKALVHDAPENFVIQNALIRCAEVIDTHQKILCSISGGADSDVMLDMMLRCGGGGKTDFVYFDTGLEYEATKEHLDALEKKYCIRIRRERPEKPIPKAVKEYGLPFWSKYASQKIYALQRLEFQWEDGTYEELSERYPKSYMQWWCNEHWGKTEQYIINRAPFMREYMIAHPPDFKISDKCCKFAKKDIAKRCLATGEYDCNCIGLRQTEEGLRAMRHADCFDEVPNGIDEFRPIWWLRDSDKEEYCGYYGVTHSRCYTEYGLTRTGCVMCPFGKRFHEEAEIVKKHEPKLHKAACNIFGKSYEYTDNYLSFREACKKAGMKQYWITR